MFFPVTNDKDIKLPFAKHYPNRLCAEVGFNFDDFY